MENLIEQNDQFIEDAVRGFNERYFMGSDKIVRHPYRSKQSKICIADSTLQIQLEEDDKQTNTLIKLPDDETLAVKIDNLKKNSKQNKNL